MQAIHVDSAGTPDNMMRPLFSLEAETQSEALLRQREAVALFANCSLGEARRLAREEARKTPALAFFNRLSAWVRTDLALARSSRAT